MNHHHICHASLKPIPVLDPVLVLAKVPVLDPAGFIGLGGNGLTPSKIDDVLSAPLHYGYKYSSESLVFGI